MWRSRSALGTQAARWIAVPVATLAVLLFGNYAYWYFAATDVEVLRTWRENRPAGYPVTYDMPTRMSIFGFPLRNGWKAVGALYADGLLDAPFEVHGKEPVADWYTRGDGYCPRDHVYYLWHESVEPADLGYNTVVRQQIEEDGYQLFGTVLVDEQPRMRIYKLDDQPIAPQSFRVEDYEPTFDRELSGPIFEKNGPSAAPAIQHELDLRFGDAIHLRGYSLDRTEALPGEGVLLTLYWQADEPIDVDYSIFTQIIDMADFHKAGQRDGEPVCNNLPTTRWLAGDTIIDRYYIPIYADAPPATYTLLVGMYDRRERRTPRYLRAGRRAPRRPIRPGRDPYSPRAVSPVAALRSHKLLLAMLLMALLIWLPRGLALDRFVTADEHAWLARSGNFYRALALGDFASTFQRHHPGVTTTWAGLAGFVTTYPAYAREAPAYFGWLTEEIEPFLRSQGHDPVRHARSRSRVRCPRRHRRPAGCLRALHTPGRIMGRPDGLQPDRASPPSTSHIHACCIWMDSSAASCSWL